MNEWVVRVLFGSPAFSVFRLPSTQYSYVYLSSTQGVRSQNIHIQASPPNRSVTLGSS